MWVRGGAELKEDMKNEPFVGTCPCVQFRRPGQARRSLHWVKPTSLDLLTATSNGDPPLCQALCNVLCASVLEIHTTKQLLFSSPFRR